MHSEIKVCMLLLFSPRVALNCLLILQTNAEWGPLYIHFVCNKLLVLGMFGDVDNDNYYKLML
jgi:hypothetical protein